MPAPLPPTSPTDGTMPVADTHDALPATGALPDDGSPTTAEGSPRTVPPALSVPLPRAESGAAEATTTPSHAPQVPSVRSREREIAVEQAVVDIAYGELDRQLGAARRALAATQAQGVSGTHQSRGERDAYAAHYSSLISTLEGVEDRLVFGRMDMDVSAGETVSNAPITCGGTRHYVGRIGLQDDRHREVIVDWRAPIARAFYQATASAPMGVVRRRHIDTRLRTVVGVEDDVIDVTALSHSQALSADVSDESAVHSGTEHDGTGKTGGAVAQVHADELQGEGALFAAMSAARDGRMGDIVATIQAEQDRIVTSDGKGILVVQGGPGTGKTAVALHRVAYLFYAERERLERTGVLLVGPSRTFLRYVDQVLPSLGETGVVATTIADLVPGVRARGVDSPAVHELKGRALWARVLARAVRNLQRVPDGPRDIVVDGTRLALMPSDVTEAMARARRSGKPHNLARETFVLWLLERLTDQFAQATRQDASDPETRAWIREDIRVSRDARREINLCWMPTTPTGLMERLWARPDLLAQVAPELTEQERACLVRPRGSDFTDADIPLIDELAELLGPSEDAQAREARVEARRRAQLVEYAAQAIESQNLGGGMVSAEMLAERMSESGPTLTVAERARADRTWTYGHIVVDEAQELGDMAWRALARRCPVRSFTVVGDLAQYSGPHAPSSWAQVLSSLGTGGDKAGRSERQHSRESAPRRPQGRRSRRGEGTTPLREHILTVCYRTPASIMQLADAVTTALGHPPVYPVRSVRDLPHCVQIDDLSSPQARASALARLGAARDSVSDRLPAECDEPTTSSAVLNASDTQAVATSPDHLCPDLTAGQWGDLVCEAVRQEVERLDAQVGRGVGRVAVITSEAAHIAGVLGQQADLAAAMEAPGGDILRARLAVMGPVLSKGLEFDVVVLLDPAQIGEVSAGDLYVAMTRPTRRLRVVSRLPLPRHTAA